VLDIAVAADGRTAAAITSSGELVLVDIAGQRTLPAIAAHTGGWGAASRSMTPPARW
jgi:hypothetical protein